MLRCPSMRAVCDRNAPRNPSRNASGLRRGKGGGAALLSRNCRLRGRGGTCGGSEGSGTELDVRPPEASGARRSSVPLAAAPGTALAATTDGAGLRSSAPLACPVADSPQNAEPLEQGRRRVASARPVGRVRSGALSASVRSLSWRGMCASSILRVFASSVGSFRFSEKGSERAKRVRNIEEGGECPVTA